MNWMRRKARPAISARVLTVRVLARPGTPSKRTWPPAMMPVRMPRTRVSLPTMRFAISARARAAVAWASPTSPESGLCSNLPPSPRSRDGRRRPRRRREHQYTSGQTEKEARLGTGSLAHCLGPRFWIVWTDATEGKTMKSSNRYVPTQHSLVQPPRQGDLRTLAAPLFPIRVVNARAAELRPPFIVVSNHVTILGPLHPWHARPPARVLDHERRQHAHPAHAGAAPPGRFHSQGEGHTRYGDRELDGPGHPQASAAWWGFSPKASRAGTAVTLPSFPPPRSSQAPQGPVLAAVIRGGFLSLPRWSWAGAEAASRVEFKLLFTADETRSLGVDELRKGLGSGPVPRRVGMGREDARPLRRAQKGRARRAVALRLSALRGGGQPAERPQPPLLRHLRHVPGHGSARPLSRSPGRAGPLCEHPGLGSLAARKPPALRRPDSGRTGRRRSAQASFSARRPALARKENESPAPPPLRHPRILFADRIVLATLLGERLAFPLSEVEGIGVLKRNLLEFYVGRDLYQVRFPFRHNSARKWMGQAPPLCLLQMTP